MSAELEAGPPGAFPEPGRPRVLHRTMPGPQPHAVPRIVPTPTPAPAPLPTPVTVPGTGAGPRAQGWGGRGGQAAKRGLDLLLAGIAVLLLSPLLLAIWAAVRLTSPGPGLFRQERLGRHEEPFVILKFRTMRADCDDELHRRYVTRLLTEQTTPSGGELFKLTDDPRVTPVGHLLRRTSLDELPQLWNVLRGDMSLVGPRPVLAWEADLFQDSERRRFAVRPGITGLWQVSGRNRLTMREALILDVEYVRRWSPALDLAIIVRTIPALLRGGAR